MKSFFSIKSNRTYILLALFCLGSFMAIAQQKRIKGKITNENDIEGIHILNTSSRYNSITNELGEFFISAAMLDTLVISSVHFMPLDVVVSSEIFESGFIALELTPMVNELAEVYLGPNLTGDLERDLKKIKVEDQINFYDVGIPGFQGKAEEKIPRMVGQVITPFAVNVEGLYKHLSGYYKKLRLRRQWEAENIAVSQIIHTYGSQFFTEAYGIPQDRLYDFLLFCIETTQLKSHFNNEASGLVLEIFKLQAVNYLDRMSGNSE